MTLLRKQGLNLLLQMPRSLRDSVFARTDLDLNCKFVLAVLYQLDSIGRLKNFKQELPVQTYLGWEQCEAYLQELVRKHLIEYTGSFVALKVKPITYKKSHA
jgi:hypothetical protein